MRNDNHPAGSKFVIGINQALHKDPAFGSGPLATVIQDLLSIAIYLGAVTVLLG